MSFTRASRGQGAGDGTSYTNTQVSGQSVQIESGAPRQAQDVSGNLVLKGAVVQAEQVALNVGGNLTIESQQDQSQYREKSQQVGGSVTFGPAPGASLSAGQTKINSDYNSVGEQSAIRAGDGGFQVSVAGQTDLVGGQITSTQAAIENKQNSYQAQGGTSTRDLNNSAGFEASSVSVGLGAGTPKPGASLSAGLSGVGIGSDKGSASSTTTAGISGIAGNTAARTGDAETGIKPIFNQDEVKQEVNAQVAITAEFGKRASKMVGDHAETQLKEAAKKQEEAEQAKANGDNARAEQLQAEANAIKDNWGDSGKLRLAAHTAIGALTGGTSGAVGAASGTLTAPLVADALRKAGVDETLASGLTALASTAVGAATGGSAGAAAAFNEVTNNFLNHPQQRDLASELNACKTEAACQAVLEKYQRISNANNTALAKAKAQCVSTGDCAEHDRLFASCVAWGQALKNDSVGKDPESALLQPVLANANTQSVKDLINRPLSQEVVHLNPATSFDAAGNVQIDPALRGGHRQPQRTNRHGGCDGAYTAVARSGGLGGGCGAGDQGGAKDRRGGDRQWAEGLEVSGWRHR